MNDLYLVSTATTPDDIAAALRFSYLGKPKPDIDHSTLTRLEVWGTRISHSGPDYCELRLYDQAGTLTHTLRVDGY